MSDIPISPDPVITDQPPVAVGNQPDPLSGLQSAIDVAAQTPDATVELSSQLEEDPEKAFVQTVKDAVRKLEEAQAKQ